MHPIKANSNPAISVVMATYNREQYLEESISSILNQTFQDFEFIIVDDASTDNTRSILRKYQQHPKIKIYTNPINRGLAASRNKAIGEANGQWIAFQDDDDVSHPERLALQHQYVLNNPEIAILGTRAELVDCNLRTFAFWDVPTTHEEMLKIIKWQSPFCHPSVLFKKNCFCSIGMYRTKFRFAEDYDLWLRSLVVYKAHNLPQYLIKVRRHKRTVSVSHLDEQLAQHVLAYIYYEQRQAIGSDRYDEMPERRVVGYLKRTYPEYIPFFANLRQSKYKSFLWEAKESRDWEKGLLFSIALAKLNLLDPIWLKEMYFFTRGYIRRLLDRHLLWRIKAR